MKLGNTSQSNVPVPNFYLNKNIKKMELFDVSDGKKYFREKDLFNNTKDINFCNNMRNYDRKHDNFNKTKYIPQMSNLATFLKTNNSYRNANTLTNTKANSTTRKTFFSKDRDYKLPREKTDTFSNYRNYMEKTNVSNLLNPGLRDEIKNNINLLIDKITYNYDLEKWGQTDTRNNFNYFNNTNFGATNFNFNNTNNMYSTCNPRDFENIKNDLDFYTTLQEDKNFNQTDASKFKTILKDKINGMTLDKKMKSKIIENIEGPTSANAGNAGTNGNINNSNGNFILFNIKALLLKILTNQKILLEINSIKQKHQVL